MARAGVAKTKLVNGQRVDIATGEAFTNNQTPTLTQVAQNAGVTNPPLIPNIDVSQVDQAQPNIPSLQPTAQQRVERQAIIPSGVADDTALTEQEDVLAQRIKSLSGRAETQSQLEEEAGIGEFEKEIRDIGAQISRRRADLTTELETIGQQGFRATAVRGQEARARRQVAAEIAGLEAAQQAAEANLETARSSAERAINAKYGPIEEDIAIQLQLIGLRKDQMTRKEKTLAEKREEELLAEQREVEREKSLLDASLKFVTDAVADGRLSPSQGSAISLSVVGGDYLALSDVPKKETGGGVQLTGKDKFDAEIKLSDKFDDDTANYRKVAQQIQIVRTSFDKAVADAAEGKSINAASQGVLVGYQKILDPSSVVRESEYARSPQGLSLIGQIEGKYEQIKQGGAGVKAEDLQEFRDLAVEFLDGYEDAAADSAERVIRQANSVGLNVDNILPDSAQDLVKKKRQEKIDEVVVGSIITIGDITYEVGYNIESQEKTFTII